ncbi:hypothetical protein Rhe02_95880 [Rhizocola hellebori]|uniref:Calx-beta domain-containing protein n=1 Tax=Rhizocola hellebori TaxID=1392758 RepID=A0A8J3QIZ7_9ACTN|nr:Calx-beta domain-containing protein [Rhizocola hellebori]GIH11521.1 hypothetical protein Rhe02_95880 [Rhizocola hellebori]
MTTARRRLAALVALLAAALTHTLLPLPAAQADEWPEIVITDGTICYERQAPDTSWFVTVELSQLSKEDVTFRMSTHDGTAKAPGDYTAFEGIEFRIPAGKLSVDVPLEIIADKEREDEEWFLVTIDSAQGAIIGTEKAEIIIRDGAPPKGGK